MGSMAWVHWLGVAAIVAPAAWSGVAGPARQDAGRTAQQLYQTYCASCHGTAGRGDGPMAAYLKVPPANLTTIAARARGVFPSEVVLHIVDGRRAVKTHGDSSMPIWGDAFSLSGSADSDTATAEKIRRLVAYVESIQQRSGD